MRISKIEDSGMRNTFDLEVNDVHEYKLKNGLRSHNTSQLMGNRPSVEPLHYNYYLRNNDNGRTVMVNPYLEERLVELGIDPVQFYHSLPDTGSVADTELPEADKELFKTVWELPQSQLFKLQQVMSTFLDQASSNNVFLTNPSYPNITTLDFIGWVLGLKTSRYYLHMKTSNAQSFSNNKCESCSG